MIAVARCIALSGFCLVLLIGCSSVGPDGTCQPRPFSDAWWNADANSPVGARQVDKCGATWPPYPRPQGPHQPYWQTYHAEHYWPWPYVCTDRHSVLDMANTQEANGWLSETTLYDYHFDPETNELTIPGKLHLEWIVQYVPASYRAVWIQQTSEQADSEQRLKNVRATATKICGEPNIPPIALRTSMAPARPAIEVDTIRRHELESIPMPRIPFESSAAGSSSTNGTSQNN